MLKCCASAIMSESTLSSACLLSPDATALVVLSAALLLLCYE
jgi:hypothetical protein